LLACAQAFIQVGLAIINACSQVRLLLITTQPKYVTEQAEDIVVAELPKLVMTVLNLCLKITVDFSKIRFCIKVVKGPVSTEEKFPRTENFPKISLLKVENFQLQHFFPTENLCRPITFYKIFFLRKIFLIGNGP
jgi:hypothetical protein